MKRNLILFTVVLLLALAAAEFVVRAMRLEVPRVTEKAREHWISVPEQIWTEFHPILGWYSLRNREAHLVKTAGHIDALVRTNRDGFRGQREYSLERPHETTRILILGDSFPFGFGVEDEETFPAVLESRSKKLEVLNLAVPGYGLDQMLLAYREIGAAFEPDYVFLCFFPDDIYRTVRAFTDAGYAKPYFVLGPKGELSLKNVPVAPRFSLKRGQYPAVIEKNFWGKGLMKSAVYRILRSRFLKLARNLKLVDPDTSEEWVLSKAIMKEWAKEVRSTRSFPVLILIPDVNWAGTERKDSLRKSLYRFSESSEIEMIDLTPVFNQAVKENGLSHYYIEDDWHWTPEGHRLAADTVLKWVEERIDL